MQIQLFKIWQLPDFRRQFLELIVVEVERLQVDQLSDFGGQLA